MEDPFCNELMNGYSDAKQFLRSGDKKNIDTFLKECGFEKEDTELIEGLINSSKTMNLVLQLAGKKPICDDIDMKRIDNERIETERVEKQRIENDRIEKERQERLEKERLETQRIEIENERLEHQRIENERIEKERLEQQRIENERIEKERIEKERQEQERIKKLTEAENLKKNLEDNFNKLNEQLEEVKKTIENNDIVIKKLKLEKSAIENSMIEKAIKETKPPETKLPDTKPPPEIKQTPTPIRIPQRQSDIRTSDITLTGLNTPITSALKILSDKGMKEFAKLNIISVSILNSKTRLVSIEFCLDNKISHATILKVFERKKCFPQVQEYLKTR